MAKWIHSFIQLEEPIDSAALLLKIEKACRTCYRSEDNIKEGSAEKLIKSCIARGHESVLEHASITYRVICDRAISHEWVRHRLAAYSQESSRYCNYCKDKFNNELTFIYPWWYDGNDNNSLWENLLIAGEVAELQYQTMISSGATPDMARSVLPNCTKTELVVTMNIRELRHFIKLRTTKAAHPDIRKLAIELLKTLQDNGLGVLFYDIEVD